MVKLIDESKARKTVNKRSIKEDYGDWEIIAKFRSKPFCIGDIDSVEDDLIDLMNTDEVAFKQIVDYLKNEGYSFGGEDFDADDYADWFTRELYDLFSVYNESELKFGYFDFKVKNLSAYYNESIKINKNNRRSIKEELDNSSYEDLKYEIYRVTERAFNSFVRNNEMNVSDDEITSIMREVTAKLLDSVIEL